MEKILVYALSENFGGVEEYTLNLSRYNKNKDHKYGYIILGNHSPYEREMKDRKIEYFKIPKKRKLIQNIFCTYSLLKRLRTIYSVLYINTSALGYIIPYLIAYSLGYKLVLHSHLDARSTSSALKIMIHKFNYQILRTKISNRLTCSKNAAKWMFGQDAEKAILIPNAVNLQRFRFSPKERNYYREKLNIGDNKVIGNIGRLTYFKNQTFLLKLLKSMKNDNVKLLLVGDGEDKNKLLMYAEKLGVRSKVIFYGKTSAPEKLMNVMDCVVMPSIAEGFPVTLVEEQAAGLPCIVSTNVTKEVDISHTLTFLSLKDPVEKWRKLILSKMNLDRYNNEEALKRGGFDVHTLENKVYKYLR